ncbi:MAG: GAF domain-containing sensor histidine kinase [Planctomycetota bacterium]|jgi:signal transduction histidine kinase
MLEDFQSLSHKILRFVNTQDSLATFLPEVLKIFLEHTGCDEIELYVAGYGRPARWRGTWRERRFFSCEMLPGPQAGEDVPGQPSGLHTLRRAILEGAANRDLPYFTPLGSFWSGDVANLPPIRLGRRESPRQPAIRLNGDLRSLAIIPIRTGNETVGILQFRSSESGACSREEVEFFENMAQTLGMLIVNQSTQGALRERLKELTCLYGITQLMEKEDLSPSEILEGIVALLPPAWQYPEITFGRVELEGAAFATPGFSSNGGTIKSYIFRGGTRIGFVEVGYGKSKPALDEGPFLKEERSLIDAIAGQIGLFLERRQAEEDKIFLQNQLRHADRLATIGQLAAGVAHELNEPLSNILGFAQLAQKGGELPAEVNQDLQKIIEASLHSREIVKNLLQFGKPMPQKMVRIQLNKVVEDALYLFEGRCEKSGIRIERELDPALPVVIADQVQMNQVLVNLLANAVPAMPDGGTLTIRTEPVLESVILRVSDSGMGMDEETLDRIFDPFFSTKKTNEGTGLGLSVVRDIVKAHKGAVRAESEVGKGSTFEVSIPLDDGE